MAFIEDLFSVANKSVLITGGSRGIGLSIAEGYVRAGARVYICGRSAEACDAAAKELRRFGNCTALPCDVASADGRASLVKALRKHEDSLDILINNAGALWAAPLDEYPEAGWQKVYDLNVKATFFLIQALLPMLEVNATAQDPGRIVNIGSANAMRIPTYETYAYASSKAAVHHLTRHLAGQLAPRFITANVIAPGRFPSKMQAATIARDGEDEIVGPIPLKRLGSDLDISAAAIYLTSRAGAYLTGAVIPVDGGMATTV